MKLGGGGGKDPNRQNVLCCLRSHRIDSKERLEPVLQHHSNQNSFFKLAVCWLFWQDKYGISIPYTRVMYIPITLEGTEDIQLIPR